MGKLVMSALAAITLAGCGGDVPEGYGASGFQATAVTFPSAGCWNVVGTVGRARLAFVVRVRATRG